MSAAVALPEGYEVVKDEYDIPCDFVACATMHRHLHNERYERPQTEFVAHPVTGETKTVRVATWHNLTKHQWVILLNGVRVGDAHDRKRDAVAEVTRFQPTI